MSCLVVIRSGRRSDEGTVLHFDDYPEALHFAVTWQQRHSADRVSIFSHALNPLAVMDADQPRSAQSGT